MRPGMRASEGSGAAARDEAPRIALYATRWRPCCRLIASRYPTVGLYDAIADPADLEVVFAIEALTNARVRDELGQLPLVPPEDRASGPGTQPIMAAFTHLNPEGSRFSDGSWGVYYAAQDFDTALAEVAHHRALFLARTAEPAIDVDLRLVTATLDASLHDLRPLRRRDPAVYDPVDYTAGRKLGGRLRAEGSAGVLYHSVRHAGGTCAGVFRPRALSAAKAALHIALHWDGERFTHWYEKREPRAVQG